MTIKFTKRVASQLLSRGVHAIRVNPSAFEEASKAITREDVRRLISAGSIFALKEKHNVSARSKLLKQKREEGRSRGTGSRRGTRKARAGTGWEKKVRSQRFLLKRLTATTGGRKSVLRHSHGYATNSNAARHHCFLDCSASMFFSS